MLGTIAQFVVYVQGFVGSSLATVGHVDGHGDGQRTYADQGQLNGRAGGASATGAVWGAVGVVEFRGVDVGIYSDSGEVEVRGEERVLRCDCGDVVCGGEGRWRGGDLNWMRSVDGVKSVGRAGKE